MKSGKKSRSIKKITWKLKKQVTKKNWKSLDALLIQADESLSTKGEKSLRVRREKMRKRIKLKEYIRGMIKEKKTGGTIGDVFERTAGRFMSFLKKVGRENDEEKTWVNAVAGVRG